MKALRPDPAESAWSRRGGAGWLDRPVVGGGVLAAAGGLSHRWAVAVAGIAMTLTLALTAQIKMAPAATSRRLTPIPMRFAPFLLQGKRANRLFRYARAGAGRAAGLSLPPHAGSCPRVARRGP